MRDACLASAAETRLVLTPREAAQALSVCEKSLWSMTWPRGPIRCVRLGRSVRYPPETRDELLAVLNERPEYARRWLPSAEWCRFLDIDPDIGKPVEPLGERERERLLLTIRDDDEFRLALRFLILGEAAA